MKNRTVRAALTRTLNLLESGWTRGFWARDKSGRAVQQESKKACRFCLSAAIQVACRRSSERTQDQAFKAVEQVLKDRGFTHGVINFNDAPGRKKSEVLNVVRAAWAYT